MCALTIIQPNLSHNENRLKTIQTNLYELIEAVILSARPEESHLTGLIVSHILDTENIRFSKGMIESAYE